MNILLVSLRPPHYEKFITGCPASDQSEDPTRLMDIKEEGWEGSWSQQHQHTWESSPPHSVLGTLVQQSPLSSFQDVGILTLQSGA